MKKENAHAVVLIQGSFTLFHRKQLAELAAKNRLPSMCESPSWTDDGCLLSYGPDSLYQWRRAAVFVDKILKGAKPADLPVEQPTKFELVINLKTAKQIGLTIPQSVLYRADKVIK
jgi:putative ABC transport system substrate-binding protein